jgi:prophage antirepressor-like protein
VLLVDRVTYHSFEDFERLLAVAVLEDETFLVGADAERLLERSMKARAPFEPPVEVATELLDDALEEAMFLDQEAVSGRTQQQFDAALVQLERYIADQTLLLKRQRGALNERMRRAEEARDAAVGSAARTRAEQSLAALASELEGVEADYQRLSDRKDERFERWSTRAHERRYAAPTRERLFTVELELV